MSAVVAHQSRHLATWIQHTIALFHTLPNSPIRPAKFAGGNCNSCFWNLISLEVSPVLPWAQRPPPALQLVSDLVPNCLCRQYALGTRQLFISSTISPLHFVHPFEHLLINRLSWSGEGPHCLLSLCCEPHALHCTWEKCHSSSSGSRRPAFPQSLWWQYRQLSDYPSEC